VIYNVLTYLVVAYPAHRVSVDRQELISRPHRTLQVSGPSRDNLADPNLEWKLPMN